VNKPPFPSRIFGSADFSEDGRYRYELTRSWDATRPSCAFVMLNPSKADAVENDPTVRRCIDFANRWGYGELRVYNVFAFVATDPRELWRQDDPVGPRWAETIRGVLVCERIICAWGAFATAADGRTMWPRHRYMDAWYEIRRVRTLHCLIRNQDGTPRHPLYVRADTDPIVFSAITVAEQDDKNAAREAGDTPET
jgi:hypothetical protein